MIATFAGQCWVERRGLELELRIGEVWGKLGEYNHTRQSLCSPPRGLRISSRREIAPPSAVRTRPPQLGQEYRQRRLVRGVADPARNQGCGEGTEEQIQGRRVTAGPHTPPVTANQCGSWASLSLVVAASSIRKAVKDTQPYGD